MARVIKSAYERFPQALRREEELFLADLPPPPLPLLPGERSSLRPDKVVAVMPPA